MEKNNIAPAEVVRTVHDREKICTILWLVSGLIMCITGVAVLAGIFNIVLAVLGFVNEKKYEEGNKWVIEHYEKEQLVWLIVAIVVNIIFGVAIPGLLGVGVAIFGFTIRDYALKNKYAFESGTEEPKAEEVKAEEVKAEEVKAEEPNAEEVKAKEEIKVGE